MTRKSHLVIVELGNILLADSVYEEGGGKGEEGEESASAEDDSSVGVGRVREQHWLARQSNAGGGEGETLDQLDLG